ncbi:MAG: topoisomerase [Parcubacteria group bacterium]|nr:topoisomerase [Parcubacteria group bacterium]
MNLIILVGFIVIALLILGMLPLIGIGRTVRGPKNYPYRRKQYLMTRNESDCYKELVQTVGAEYFIFAQVHLSTLLDEKIKGNDWRASRSHINRKSVDFVLCDKQNISPILAIELDDSSHLRADRVIRDSEVERILREAGLPLLRITSIENIGAKINEILRPQANP